jgi:hypothetical protein
MNAANAAASHPLIFYVGAVLGAIVVGLLVGLIPLAVGFLTNQKRLGTTGFISCFVSSLIAGALLAVPVAAGFSIYIAVKSNRTNKTDAPPSSPAAQPNAEEQLRDRMRKKTALSGVGGWLIFFCVGLTILGPLWSIGQLTSTYEKAKPALDRFPALKSAVDFETGGSVILLIYGFIVGCIIWSGSPSGRRVARQFLVIRLVGFLGIEAITFSMISDMAPAATAAGTSEAFTAIFREVIYFLIWWFYFKRSVRVRNTYGPERT